MVALKTLQHKNVYSNDNTRNIVKNMRDTCKYNHYKVCIRTFIVKDIYIIFRRTWLDIFLEIYVLLFMRLIEDM